MIERKGERERNRNARRWQERKAAVRERKRERECTSLQGGFPEVTVLNITEECGMLNRCQGKHTDRATAAPNSRQGLHYIHTQRHTNMQTYLCTRLYFGPYRCTLTHWLLALLLCSHIQHIPLQKQSTPAEDIIFRKLSWLYRPSLGITVNRDSFIY